MHSRTVYDIIGVFGYVGGIISSLAIIVSMVLIPYAEMCFRMEAIPEMYLAESQIDNTRAAHIKFTTSDKLVSYFNLCCCRKTQMEVASRGSELLDKEMDCLDLIMNVKQVKTYLKKSHMDWKKLVDEVPKDEAKRIIKIGELNEEEKTYYRIKNKAGNYLTALDEHEKP